MILLVVVVLGAAGIVESKYIWVSITMWMIAYVVVVVVVVVHLCCFILIMFCFGYKLGGRLIFRDD